MGIYIYKQTRYKGKDSNVNQKLRRQTDNLPDPRRNELDLKGNPGIVWAHIRFRWRRKDFETGFLETSLATCG